MRNHIKRVARQRLALSTQIVAQRDAVYAALTKHTGNCACRLVALHLLDMAKWDEADFLREYEAGHLDG